MKEIIGLKNRLLIIKAIFELQKKMKCFVPIVVFPKGTNWDTFGIEAECLQIDNPNKKQLHVLYEALEFSNKTIDVYDDLLKIVCAIDKTSKIWKDTRIEITSFSGSNSWSLLAKENNKYYYFDDTYDKWIERDRQFDNSKDINVLFEDGDGTFSDNLFMYDYIFKIVPFLKKLITDLQPQQETTTPKEFAALKIKSKFNPDLVFDEFKSVLKCDIDTFKDWFVDGKVSDKKMSWKYDDQNKTQLRSFLFELCGGWSPKETNKAFKISVDSNTRQTNLNDDLLKKIDKCKF